MTLKKALFVSSVFLGLNIILDMWGDTNTRSRLALLAALKEDHSFKIDPYKTWTIDWAQTPDGHIFSNKAPGPAFLALPLYFVLDSALTWGIESRQERDEIRTRNAEAISQVLSIIFQVFGFIALYFWALKSELLRSLSLQATAFFSLAFYLGTTATLFMNTFFGHGLAAILATGLLLALLEGRWQLAGLLFGWGVLTDYGSALLLPGAMYLLWDAGPHKRTRRIKSFLLGGVLPGVFWIYYHTVCFGSPFILPNRFQNPEFVVPSQEALWGIFASYPRPEALFQLLFGNIRGILFTQPWLLGVLILSPFALRRQLVNSTMAKAIGFSSVGLILLLIMNASFINWHAGGSPGPRYLCAIFPIFAMTGAKLMDALPRIRSVLWIGLGVSLVFGSLVFASHRLQNPEDMAIWRFYFSEVFLSGARMPIARFALYWGFVGVLLMGLFNFKRKSER